MDGTKRCQFFITVVWVLAVCGAIPIGDLLDRASQHSDKLHSLSTLLTNELDTHFPPIGRMIMPRPSMCHTSTLQGPTDKDQALQVSEQNLMSLVRSLLQSWADPLVLLSANANTLPHPAQSSIASKVQELQQNSKSLGDGLDILSNRMGPAAQVVSILPYQGTGDFGQDKIAKLINFQFLLSCFRRDSHKIDSFLKVLRCRSAQMRPEMC
ncbi:prolactin [Eucyclogobius newberryi]|uniref:prolactin n=1 Tax=Eucyclogobius newberryi TaxID=166745 RepID=UPI003B5D0071